MFCDSAMQQYRGAFQNPPLGGMNIGINQLCLRERDINSVGDGITLQVFNMLSILRTFAKFCKDQTINLEDYSEEEVVQKNKKN